MEKRKIERQKINTDIMVKMDNHPGKLIDISENGCCLCCSKAPYAYHEISIEINSKKGPIFLHGTVKWMDSEFYQPQPKQIGFSLDFPTHDYLNFVKSLTR
jgi:hypothetical protein